LGGLSVTLPLMDSRKFVSIKEASQILGVHSETLRRWERTGKIKCERTPGGKRRFLLADIQTFNPLGINKEALKRMTVGYARVSSHDQKDDLVRQKQILEMYCSSHGWSFEIIDDLGSGMNYRKKGLRKLMELILSEKIGRLVLTHKDRLLRFGAELIFSLCEAKNVEVVIINNGDDVKTYEQELAEDVLEIITVFSARLYGSRSHKNKKIIDGISKVLADV
jgi:excisionase family DNA binding protein